MIQIGVLICKALLLNDICKCLLYVYANI